MQVMNILTWLQATVTCPTIYSNKGIDANDQSLLVKPEEPWMLLKLYTSPLPSNCAILLLDDMNEFFNSIPIVKKSRVKVTFVLTMAKNSSELQSESWPPMHNEVHIVQLNKDGQIKGLVFIPFPFKVSFNSHSKFQINLFNVSNLTYI